MLDDVLSFERLDVLRHLLALLIAYVLALPIGWNREREERSAGLRTFPLVAVACCGFMQAAEGRVGSNPEGLGAVIQGLITGIGFIGGGAILKLNNSVKGTATAASLWATGALGTAVGLGAYDVAVAISLLTVISLLALPRLKPETGPDRDKGVGGDKNAQDDDDEGTDTT